MPKIDEFDVYILNSEYDIKDCVKIYGSVLSQARGFRIMRQYNERGVMLTHILTVDVEVSGSTYTCLLNAHEKHLKIKQLFEEAVEDDKWFEDNDRAEGSTEICTGKEIVPT